jgi:hypothetical protein
MRNQLDAREARERAAEERRRSPNWDDGTHLYYRLDGPAIAKEIGPLSPEYKTEGWFRIRSENDFGRVGMQREIMEARGLNWHGVRISPGSSVNPTSKMPFVTQAVQLERLIVRYDASKGAGAAKRQIQALRALSPNGISLKHKIQFLSKALEPSAMPGRRASALSGQSAGNIPVSKPTVSPPASPVPSAAARTMKRAQFGILSPKQQLEFCRNGGRLVD